MGLGPGTPGHVFLGMVEKWDQVLGPPGTLVSPGLSGPLGSLELLGSLEFLEPPGPPVPQDPQELWTLGPSGTSGPFGNHLYRLKLRI